MNNFNNFQKLIRHLKFVLPLEHKVSVRRKKLPIKVDGDCSFISDKFLIRVDNSLQEYYAIEVLLHEFAHVLSWDMDEDIHGPNWGKAYSLVYREFLIWNEN